MSEESELEKAYREACVMRNITMGLAVLGLVLIVYTMLRASC